MEKGVPRDLCPAERRALFSRACFAPSIVNTRLEGELVLPRLVPGLRIQAIS